MQWKIKWVLHNEFYSSMNEVASWLNYPPALYEQQKNSSLQSPPPCSCTTSTYSHDIFTNIKEASQEVLCNVFHVSCHCNLSLKPSSLITWPPQANPKRFWPEFLTYPRRSHMSHIDGGNLSLGGRLSGRFVTEMTSENQLKPAFVSGAHGHQLLVCTQGWCNKYLETRTGTRLERNLDTKKNSLTIWMGKSDIITRLPVLQLVTQGHRDPIPTSDQFLPFTLNLWITSCVWHTNSIKDENWKMTQTCILSNTQHWMQNDTCITRVNICHFPNEFMVLMTYFMSLSHTHY